MNEVLEELAASVPGELAEEIKEELIEQWNADVPRALERQEAAAAAVSREELVAVDGIGELVMQVDPAIYHWWNKKLPGCWQDKGFRDWFKKNFPETAVRCKGSRKVTVLMPGMRKR